MRLVAFPSFVLAGLVAFAPAPSAGQVCTDTNGTFRFLNDQFPDGTTNAEYVARLIVVNADGPVTFSVTANEDPLPAGLSLDPESGLVTGLPTQSSSKSVEFQADDGTQQVTQVIDINISSSGGGGNGAAQISQNALADGRVGAAYSQTLAVLNGTGPFTFGGSDLPPGLSLNGSTGALTGTPTAPGTYFANFTVHDAGEANVVQTVIPIRILPLSSDFAFLTQFLNNGEVGTPYCDAWLVENPALGGTVTFGASGLAPGLVLEPETGAVTGTPTQAGTFLVTISASDGTDTIVTNLTLIVAPSSSSVFHWNFFGLPEALVNEAYDRNPPIVVAAEGLSSIDHTAVGLPAGISYDIGSGELSGTPAQVGEFPVTFTATDGVETITLDALFVVLPATGGDVGQISVNFWVSRASLRLGTDGSEAWRVSALYNADRRTGGRFDPATDVFRAVLGTRTLELAAGAMTGDDQAASFSSAGPPSENVSLNADRQSVSWSTGSDTIAETVPGILAQRVTIGDRAFRLLLRFDERGGFRPALAFERTAFVLSRGSLAVNGPGLDSAKLGLLLADPAFSYALGDTLRIRILDGATVLMDRDFTALGGAPKLGLDGATGRTTYAFRTLADAAVADRVAMSYSSSKGAVKLSLSAMNLSAITAGEAHLTFELTIDERVYSTGVTFFGTAPGTYGLAIP